MADFLHIFDEAAEWIAKLPMFPLFDTAHFILMTAAVRQDAGIEFSRRNPLSCWLCCMLSCFAGGVLANFLLGAPILNAFENQQAVGLATCIWYLVFYCPYDIFHKLTSWMPLLTIIVILKEVSRPRKILAGIAQAAKLYPKGYHLMVLIGMVKASGSNWMKMFERLMRGVWTPQNHEVLKPSFILKAAVLGSVLFVLQKQGALQISRDHLLLFYTAFLVIFKVAMVTANGPDPFVQLEGLTCFIMFGSEKEDQAKKVMADSKKKKE
ncbi:trimeric intracellular cation channel type 1B.1-like [Glandiceps talaboti]